VLAGASWWWVAATLVITQTTAVSEAVAMSGAVPAPLPLGPLVLLRMAMWFTGLIGGTAATTATVVRFYQRRGLAPVVAVSSGLIYSAGGFCVQVVLSVTALIFAGDVPPQAGASASLGALIIVCTFTSLLGGIAPVPGGMGVMEASYISLLTLLGIPEDLAIAATLLYRLCTTYLPPIWGWAALVWLRRHENYDQGGRQRRLPDRRFSAGSRWPGVAVQPGGARTAVGQALGQCLIQRWVCSFHVGGLPGSGVRPPERRPSMTTARWRCRSSAVRLASPSLTLARNSSRNSTSR
jgi:hypothetical protein